jgi:RHS repeat-associated protein
MRSHGEIGRRVRFGVAVLAALSLVALATGIIIWSIRPSTNPPPQAYAGPAVTDVRPVPPHFQNLADPAKRNAAMPAPIWPTAAAATIDLRTKPANAKVLATGTPVWAQSVAGGAQVALDVRVADHATTLSTGAKGLLFSVGAAQAGAVRIGVNYGAFAQAYGGNFGSRLRLVELPTCAVTAPSAVGCARATPVPSTLDLTSQSVSASVQFNAAPAVTTAAARTGFAPVPGGRVFALTSDSGTEGGSGGSYAATDLKPSGSWSAGGSTGAFDYSYPIQLPPADSSLVPNVDLSYDSSSVDGQTASTQAQASWVGDGWSTPASFVEESNVACSDNPEGSASPVSTSDQCYAGPVLTLSLNGSSSSLVWDASSSTFHPQQDDGSKVTHVTSSGNGSGTYNTDYWTVTRRDGTVYSFGLNHLPGWASGRPATNSVDSEPVYSAHAGDPCYNAAGFTSSVCTMAYRWNLDYVKDVHGNAMAYYYQQDTNFYGEDNGAHNVSYVRASRLDHIDYGFTDGNAFGTVPDKVVFSTGDRCLSGTCQPLNSTNSANWPDVPFDLVCASGTTCSSYSPAFFSTVRLTAITTQQWSVSAGAYQTIDSYALSQTIPPTGDGTSPTLWLSSITRTGSDLSGGASASITQPPVSFTGVQLQNRVDTVSDGLPAFYRYRLATVTTESGSVIAPTYGLPNPCTAPVTLNPASNTSSCYPVQWTPSGASQITDWFNKYATTHVTATDPTGGAPAQQTSYSYLGGAAWHYDDNELVQAKYRSYAQFRGYGDVKTLTGDGSTDPQTLSETTYYRGMSKNNNTTVVNLTDSAGGTHEDVNELSGQALETTDYLGNGGPVDHSTISSYWISAATATRNRTGLNPLTAKVTAAVESYTRQAVTGSGPTTWRVTENDTAYDANTASATFGLATAQYTHTVPAVAAYDQCTTTSYAPANSALNLTGLVAEAESDSVACGGYTAGSPASVPGSLNTLTAPTTVSRPGQVISDTRTFYDDPTWSTTFPQASAPTKGDATMVRKAADYTAGAFTYQTTSRSTYDSVGRHLDSYDANGNKTSTAYTVDSSGLTTGVTTTNPLNQTSSVTVAPARGLQLTSTDINGIVVTERYDALGRVTSVWQNSRATTSPANLLYTYQMSNSGPTTLTTQTLNDESGYRTATTIFDALLRPRQTQAMTPQSGRLVTDTFYDSHGWVRQKNGGWWDPATTPNTTLVAPAGLNPPAALPSQDMYTHDGLGRVVVDASEQNNAPVSYTVTVYNGDRTTAIPPISAVATGTVPQNGGAVSTSITDPLGRVSEVDTYQTAPTLTVPSNTFTGTFAVSGGTVTPITYGFDGHNQQSSVTEPGPHTWTATYNLLGQKVATTDPDAGSNTLTYDADDNLLQAVDGRGKTTSYTYDALNRKTASYDAATSAQAPANQLNAFVYDNSNNAVAGMTNPKGHLTTSTAFWNGAAYTSQEKNFNVFGESLGTIVTIPSSTEGSLLGTSYTFTHVYTPTTGLTLKDIYPAAGGLPAETVLHGYAGVLDLPNTLGGQTGYAQGTTYDAFGRVNQETLGASPNQTYLTNSWDAHTGRLTDQLITRQAGAPSTVDEEAYTYDLAGNITRQVDTTLGSSSTSETQCYQYDPMVELTAAWTATDNCAATPTAASHAMVGDNLGAANAYWTTWGFVGAGRSTQVQHSLTGGSDATTTSTFDGNGAHQPHTLTATSGGAAGNTSYGYDAAGNMTSRQAGQGNQTLAWNDASQLTGVTGSTSGNSTFKYDANGSLLVQADPGATTLYLPGEQLTLNTSTQTVTGSRSYPLPGGGTATRTGTGSTAVTFSICDQHNTPTLYLDYAGATPTWRRYTPYGEPRGGSVTAPDNHGFLNKPMDTATALTVVGAREYDPTLGRFVSVDPVLESKDPLQLNGYSYAGNNPMTKTDPTGLMWSADDGPASAPAAPKPVCTAKHADGANYCIGSAKNPTVHGAAQDDQFTYDPNAKATLGDHLSWNKWKAVAAACGALADVHDSANNPAGCSKLAEIMYDHYRDNTGTDVTYDLTPAYSEDARIRNDIDVSTTQAQQAAEELYAQSGMSDFSMTGDSNRDDDQPSTGKWQKVIGAYDRWGSADVHVKDGVVTMTFTMHAEDRWNFNVNARDVTSGASDNDNGRFAVLGWAQGFNTHGTMVRTVSWKLGDPDHATIVNGAPAGLPDVGDHGSLDHNRH